MRIRTKNIIIFIFQTISVLLLFCPGVYIDEAWIADFPGGRTLRGETPVPFITKLTEADVGRFVGILALCAMVFVLIICLVQLVQKRHIPAISILSVSQTILLMIYSFSYTEESWDVGNSVTRYPVAFVFFVILASLIAVTVFAFVSNYKIREYGIQEEATSTTIYTPTSDADELKKLKELLDMGVITQEEFDAKKKQILGL